MRPYLDRRTLLVGAAALAAAASAQAAPAVVRTLTLMVRKPGQTHEQFMRYWLEVHAPMARRVPGVKAFIANEVTGTRARADIPAGPPIEIDGIAESWHEEGLSPANPGAPPEARAWFADGPEFVGALKTFATREHVFVPPKRGGSALFSLLTRKPADTHEAFVQKWLVDHGPVSRTVPGVAGFVLSEITGVRSRRDVPLLAGLDDVDGIAQSWRPEGVAPAGLTSPEAAAWYAHGASIIGATRTYVTREHVIIPPTYS